MYTTRLRSDLKSRFRNRERIFAAWVSYCHPSITETMVRGGFDCLFIDMEHSTITVEQGQRIISASQGLGVPCIPRPVSHSEDVIKPLLDSGADGMLFPYVETKEEVDSLLSKCKYPPIGRRTYGVNRAQAYGLELQDYIKSWNSSSLFMLQVESKKGVDNIRELVDNPDLDGVMVGPLDLAGSLGFPGEPEHEVVQEACAEVAKICKEAGVSCGTQISDASRQSANRLFELGFNFAILGSDLFAFTKWTEEMKTLIGELKR